MKDSLLIGTMYSFDLDGLAGVGKTLTGVRITYKKGGVIDITFKDDLERDVQYSQIIEYWRSYRESL